MDDSSWWPLKFEGGDRNRWASARFDAGPRSIQIVHRAYHIHTINADGGFYFYYNVDRGHIGDYFAKCEDILELRCYLLELARKGLPEEVKR